ncbi:MAG: GNAT family protein [Alphaproteobacteria bacterium]|nr:GNAT family protein [Alphaproteobacteria bacterium]
MSLDLATLPTFDPRPATLTGQRVLLRPASLEDAPALAAACPPGTTQWFPVPVDDEAAWRRVLPLALSQQDQGNEVVFTMVDTTTGQVCGSSRYIAIERVHRRLEIGWTVIGPAWHGTGINTEAKLLMLGHAFDTLGATRVEFKTDSLNTRSRAALRAIGAVEEGTFRNHMVVPGPRLRHSVYFSVIREEWSEVRAGLRNRFQRQHPAFA